MRTSRYVVLGAAALLGVSTLAFAQRGPGGGMWQGMKQGGGMWQGGRMWQGGGMRQGGGNYNLAAELTLTGTIDEVRQMGANGPGGVHLLVRSDDGVVEVHLGPGAFIAEKKVELAAGDAISVIGSKVQMAGRDVIIAREITKGGQVLALRDTNGFPLWSGRGAGCPCCAGSSGN